VRVYVQNDARSRVFVAIMKYDPGACEPDTVWRTKGWWALNPGDDAFVAWTNNRFIYIYAESVDGLVWSGPFGPVYVFQAPFDECLVGSSAAMATVGMFQVDVGGAGWVPLSHTVRLVL
jgi:hypothetical protein